MYSSIGKIIRKVVAELSDGDVVKKFKPAPKNKPPRRTPSIMNKSDRSDYMKNYMSEYREDGKDYQNMPDKIKELRKKQREEKKTVLSKKGSKVFLGGTVAGSHWRDDLIKLLDIDFFDPVVDDWTDEAQEKEKTEKKKCNIHLYVITSDMEGVFSIAEAVDSSTKKDKKTLFQIMPKGFDKHQLKSLEATADIIKSNGGTIIIGDNLDKTAKTLNSWGSL